MANADEALRSSRALGVRLESQTAALERTHAVIRAAHRVLTAATDTLNRSSGALQQMDPDDKWNRDTRSG
jgi:hypothetical protein